MNIPEEDESTDDKRDDHEEDYVFQNYRKTHRKDDSSRDLAIKQESDALQTEEDTVAYHLDAIKREKHAESDNFIVQQYEHDKCTASEKIDDSRCESPGYYDLKYMSQVDTWKTPIHGKTPRSTGGAEQFDHHRTSPITGKVINREFESDRLSPTDFQQDQPLKSRTCYDHEQVGGNSGAINGGGGDNNNHHQMTKLNSCDSTKYISNDGITKLTTAEDKRNITLKRESRNGSKRTRKSRKIRQREQQQQQAIGSGVEMNGTDSYHSGEHVTQRLTRSQNKGKFNAEISEAADDDSGIQGDIYEFNEDAGEPNNSSSQGLSRKKCESRISPIGDHHQQYQALYCNNSQAPPPIKLVNCKKKKRLKIIFFFIECLAWFH